MFDEEGNRIIDAETLALIESMSVEQVLKFLHHIGKFDHYDDLTEAQKDVLSVIRRKHAAWVMRQKKLN